MLENTIEEVTGRGREVNADDAFIHKGHSSTIDGDGAHGCSSSHRSIRFDI
jgi:hypothetical protein